DERQAVAELLLRAVGERSRHQRMRDRLESRLRGQPEHIVVERTSIQALTGYLGESRHPVSDELLTTCVEFGVSSAEAWTLLGRDELDGQNAEKHAPSDTEGSPEQGQRHHREPPTAQKRSTSPEQPACRLTASRGFACARICRDFSLEFEMKYPGHYCSCHQVPQS